MKRNRRNKNESTVQETSRHTDTVARGDASLGRFMSSVNSALLYGVEVWAHALTKKFYRSYNSSVSPTGNLYDCLDLLGLQRLNLISNNLA